MAILSLAHGICKYTLEINMHHLRGNAIPAGHVQCPLNDCDEICVVEGFLVFPRFVQIST